MIDTPAGRLPRPGMLGNRPLKAPAPMTEPTTSAETDILVAPDLDAPTSMPSKKLPPSVTDPLSPVLAKKPEPKRKKAEPPPPVEGALLTADDVAAILRISVKALEHHRRRGTGPDFLCLGGCNRGIRYTQRAVDDYLQQLAGKPKR